MPRHRKQALPFRLSYLDTEVLKARLLAIYHSEDEFTLQVLRRLPQFTKS